VPEIGQRVRTRRLALGLTQEELGEAIGWHHTAVSRLENDRTGTPTGDTLTALADALDCTTDYLLGREDR
jgi:transcriptional regulator with XRE-family HTH domain